MPVELHEVIADVAGDAVDDDIERQFVVLCWGILDGDLGKIGGTG